jgi:hypothetical protein
LIEYTNRPRRTINEVMYEFRAAKVPPEYILDLLPPMRARGFSISSSPAVRIYSRRSAIGVAEIASLTGSRRQGRPPRRHRELPHDDVDASEGCLHLLYRFTFTRYVFFHP